MVQMNTTPQERLEALKAQMSIPLSINNARQLGGYPLSDGRRVRDGLLLRTTQLCECTQEDLEKLERDYHLALILDMRNEDEAARMPDPEIPGAKWVLTPIIDMEFMKESVAARFQAHADSLPEELKLKPSDDPEFQMPAPETIAKIMAHIFKEAKKNGEEIGTGAYASYLESPLGREKLGIFFREIASAPEDGAVLWHCFTGKDRTGIAAGLLLDVLGADWETIVADYELSNLYFQEALERMSAAFAEAGDLDEDVQARLLGMMAGVHESMLRQAWDYMASEWGGAVSYLRDACGVPQEALDAIRDRYSEPAV